MSDTRAFLQGWRRFFEERRRACASTVVRTAIVSPAVAVLDVRGLATVFDTTRVRKRYGFGPAVPRRDLLGHVVPTVFRNGAGHAAQKQFLLTLMRHAAPRLEPALVAATDAALARWAHPAASRDWGAELDRLLVDFLFEWLLGGRADLRDATTWGDHILSPVPFPLPWAFPPAPRGARIARDRLLADIRHAPRFEAAAVLGRELAGLTTEDTAAQLLFLLLFNAWGGLHGALRSLVAELSVREALRHALRDELRGASPLDPPTLAMAQRLPRLRGTVLETLRLHGPVPLAYAEALDDLAVESDTGIYRVRRGEVLQGVLWMAALDPRVFPDPDQFDPSRHLDPAVARVQVWSHGLDDRAPAPDNKVCAGRDVVVAVLTLVAARLLWGWEWSLEGVPRWSRERVVRANCPVDPLVLTAFRPVDR